MDKCTIIDSKVLKIESEYSVRYILIPDIDTVYIDKGGREIEGLIYYNEGTFKISNTFDVINGLFDILSVLIFKYRFENKQRDSISI